MITTKTTKIRPSMVKSRNISAFSGKKAINKHKIRVRRQRRILWRNYRVLIKKMNTFNGNKQSVNSAMTSTVDVYFGTRKANLYYPNPRMWFAYSLTNHDRLFIYDGTDATGFDHHWIDCDKQGLSH